MGSKNWFFCVYFIAASKEDVLVVVMVLVKKAPIAARPVVKPVAIVYSKIGDPENMHFSVFHFITIKSFVRIFMYNYPLYINQVSLILVINFFIQHHCTVIRGL
jgi:hypothetical protein